MRKREKYVDALRICKSMINNRLAQYQRSLNLVQGNLYRNFTQQDFEKARGNIENLVQIKLQYLGYDKILNEITILERSTDDLVRKSISSEVQLAIDKLNSVSRLDKTNILKKELSKFPSPNHKLFDISHEISVFFGCDTITNDDICVLMPEIAQTLNIPLEFLEMASGRRATIAAPPVPPPMPYIPPYSCPMPPQFAPPWPTPECPPQPSWPAQPFDQNSMFPRY